MRYLDMANHKVAKEATTSAHQIDNGMNQPLVGRWNWIESKHLQTVAARLNEKERVKWLIVSDSGRDALCKSCLGPNQ
jgi:hypothetical protein